MAESIFFNALAIATAGKICPPVPPPAIMIRLLTSKNVQCSILNFQRAMQCSDNWTLIIEH